MNDLDILLDRARVLREDGRLHAAADALDLCARLDRQRGLPALRAALDELAYEDAGLTWRYVPAGRFRMGDDLGDLDERPARVVDAAGFFLADAPVAVDDVGFNPRRAIDLVPRAIGDIARLNVFPPTPRAPAERTPFVAVSHQAALALARHVQARLPTELEWERAARGCLEDAAYPWGDDAPSPARATFGVLTAGASRACPPNDYGLFAMAGNVWEWCVDVYDATAYGGARVGFGRVPADDAATAHVLRGGSFMDAPEALRVSFRAAARVHVTSPCIGVRPARDIQRAAR